MSGQPGLGDELLMGDAIPCFPFTCEGINPSIGVSDNDMDKAKFRKAEMRKELVKEYIGDVGSAFHIHDAIVRHQEL